MRVPAVRSSPVAITRRTRPTAPTATPTTPPTPTTRRPGSAAAAPAAHASPARAAGPVVFPEVSADAPRQLAGPRPLPRAPVPARHLPAVGRRPAVRGLRAGV